MRDEELARAEEVLLDEEMGRMGDFVQLFRECLGPTMVPSRAEVIVARAKAAAAWRYDRLSSTGEFYRERVVGSSSGTLARREEFADTDHRKRLRDHLLDEIGQADSLLEILGGETMVLAAPLKDNREKVT